MSLLELTNAMLNLAKRICLDLLVQFSGVGLIGDYSDFLTAQHEERLIALLNQVQVVEVIPTQLIESTLYYCPLFL